MPFRQVIAGFVQTGGSGGGGGQNQTPWLSDINGGTFSLTNADISTVTVGDNGEIQNLFDGLGNAVKANQTGNDFVTFFSGDGYTLNGQNGDFLTSNGLADDLTLALTSTTLASLFNSNGYALLAQAAGPGIVPEDFFGLGPPVADSTYTVGIGVTTNGTITTQQGIITAIQEAT